MLTLGPFGWKKGGYGPSSILVKDDLIYLILLRTSFGLDYRMRACQDLNVGGHVGEGVVGQGSSNSGGLCVRDRRDQECSASCASQIVGEKEPYLGD